MRFVVIATRNESAPPEKFTPEVLQAEAKAAMKMWADDFIRDLYSRTDGKGAIVIVEAADEAEVTKKLGTLPFMQQGLLSIDIYGIKAYRAIAALAES